MVILYFCREARGAALPLRSPGFPEPEEGQGCPGECAGVWGQSVIILCHVAVAGCLGVPGGGGQSGRMRSCVPKGQALLGWGSHKRFVSPVHCPLARERVEALSKGGNERAGSGDGGKAGRCAHAQKLN